MSKSALHYLYDVLSLNSVYQNNRNVNQETFKSTAPVKFLYVRPILPTSVAVWPNV